MGTDAAAPVVAPLHLGAVIRPATADDLPKLEWFGQYWHYRHIFRRTFHEQLRGRRLMLVAAVNGFPIGQLFIQFESAEARLADGAQRAYLYSLRVMAPYRRRGLGSRLILAGEDAVLTRGYREATLAVAKDNTGALRLYARLGYRVFGEDPGRWSYTDPAGRRHRVSEPAWVMHKQLIGSGLIGRRDDAHPYTLGERRRTE